MPKLTILQGQTTTDVTFEGTPLISSVLQTQGMPFSMPCGGKGVCGQCKVEAIGMLSLITPKEKTLGSRLACQTRLLGDAYVTLPTQLALQNIAASGIRPNFALRPMQGRYGLAVDIGTTTLAATLLLLENGEVLATATAENPQRSIASDVIGRIEAAISGKAELLQRLVTHAIDQLRSVLCTQMDIPIDALDQTVITGNTTMLYLFTGQDSEPLSHAPFLANCLFGQWIAPYSSHVYLPHCVSAFIGADITCAILASQLCHSDETALLVDVGTNGEIVLWHQGKLYMCATAAGPAFEGGGIEHGCGSVVGAIDHVWAQEGQLHCSTIGNVSATGLCGSGVIDMVATLLQLEQLDETGMLCEERVPLDGAIAFTQRDVRNLQLAKSAITAGMLTLCQTVGVDMAEVATLYLAGGFGKHIDLQNAAAIGLIPRALISKTKVIGNAALVGAEMLLLQRDFLQEIETYAHNCKVVTLSGNPVFSDHYIMCMMLEPA